jgi:hypothetical protein
VPTSICGSGVDVRQTAGVANLSVLEREMYSEAEAARYLRVAQNTFNY